MVLWKQRWSHLITSETVPASKKWKNRTIWSSNGREVYSIDVHIPFSTSTSNATSHHHNILKHILGESWNSLIACVFVDCMCGGIGGGHQFLLFWPIFPENCMELNKIEQRGGHAPLALPKIYQCPEIRYWQQHNLVRTLVRTKICTYTLNSIECSVGQMKSLWWESGRKVQWKASP